jgi:type IV secretory pathway TraG/TraD family ATPase VirD4
MQNNPNGIAVAICLLGAIIAFCIGDCWLSIPFGMLAAYFLAMAFGRGLPMGDSKTVLYLLGQGLTIDEVCAHIGVFMRSGGGKTVAILRTILIQLLRNIPTSGFLILDEKGDLHKIVVRILKALGMGDRLLLLRVRLPSDPDEVPKARMNLIGDRRFPWSTYAQLVIDTAVSQGQKSPNPFFKVQGQTVITAVFQTLEMLNMPITLSTAYDFVAYESNFKIFTMRLEDVKTREASDLVEFWSGFKKKAPEEKSGIMSTAENYLRPYSEPLVADVFCSQDPNVQFLDIDTSKVILFSIPQLYLNSRSYVNAFGKMLFFYYGLHRYDLYDDDAMKLQPPRFLVIDEFQNSLLASEEGIADHKSLDKLRGARCGFIGLAQSYSSLKPNIQDDSKVNTILANINTHIVGAIKDEPGRKLASANFLEHMVKKYSYTSRRNGNDTSITTNTEQKPVYPSYFFGKLKKFEAVMITPEGKVTHGFIPPPTDDGKKIATWFKMRLFKTQFEQ